MKRFEVRLLRFFVGFFILIAAGCIFNSPGTTAEVTEQTEPEKAATKKRFLEQIEKLKSELSQDPNNTNLMIKIAERYGWADQPIDAVPFYEKVHAIEPDNLEVMDKLRSFYSWADQPDKAIVMMEKILERRPDDIELRQKLAKQYGWSKRKADAIREWEKIVALQPDDNEARKSLADMYAWDKQTDKAMREYEELLRRDPGNLAYMEKIAFHYMWNGRTDDAERLFKQILDKDPANVSARNGLGDLYSYSARNELAAREYLRVLDDIEREGDEISTYKKLASNYGRVQALDKSKEYYERILIEDPSNADALAGLEKIRSKLRPEVFSRFDTIQRKNDYDKEIYTVGFVQRTLDRYEIRGHYILTRREDESEPDRDDYLYHTAGFDVLKDLPDGFRVGGGVDLNIYEINDSVEADYYAQVIRYDKRITGSVTYRKQAEDSEEDDLEQEVDRHSLISSLYFNLNEHLSFSTLWDGRYHTKGNAPDDNWGLVASVAPILHLSRKPVIDLSLIYYRASFRHQDRSPDEQFEYYHPEKEEVTSGNLYLQHNFTKEFGFSFSDTLSYERHPDHWSNVIRTEITLKPDEDNKLSVVYYKSFPVINSPDDYNHEQQWTVKYSHVF